MRPAATKGKLIQGLENTLFRCLGISETEKILILSDENVDQEIPLLFYSRISANGNPVAALTYPVLSESTEYPDHVASSIYGSDLVIAITNFHPTVIRTRTIWRATYEYGVRVIHFDPPHELALATAARSDCTTMVRRAEKLLSKLEGSNSLRITGANGTDFAYHFNMNSINASDHFPVNVGTLPHGLFVPHPVQGSVNGVAVFDAIDGFEGFLERPLSLEIKNSYVTAISDGKEARLIKKIFSDIPGSNYFGETGIGINPDVPLARAVQFKWHEMADRSAGIVHAGIGSTYFTKSDVSFHRHLLIAKPTVQTEDTKEVLVKNGKLTV